MLDIVKGCNVDSMHFTGDDILLWGSLLSSYHSKIPGITSHRCFKVLNNSNEVLLYNNCSEEGMKVVKTLKSFDCTEKPKTYREANKMKVLNTEKLRDLEKCYSYLLHIEKCTDFFSVLKKENEAIQQANIAKSLKRKRSETEEDIEHIAKEYPETIDCTDIPQIPPSLLSGLITLSAGDLVEYWFGDRCVAIGQLKTDSEMTQRETDESHYLIFVLKSFCQDLKEGHEYYVQRKCCKAHYPHIYV
jgi:hypothetical protein